MPDSRAPIMKPTATFTPSRTSSTIAITTPTIPIVLYWRLREALGPHRIPRAISLTRAGGLLHGLGPAAVLQHQFPDHPAVQHGQQAATEYDGDIHGIVHLIRSPFRCL